MSVLDDALAALGSIPVGIKDLEDRVSVTENRISTLEKQVVLINVALQGLPNNPNPTPPPALEVYSPTVPHWSKHKRQQWTDFGFSYRNMSDPAVIADFNLKASRVDQIMSGNGANWHAAMPSMSWGPYFLVFSCVIEDTNHSKNRQTCFGGTLAGGSSNFADDYAATNGVDAERFFLHYYDGQAKISTTKNVSAITALSPATLTVTAHGYTTGDRVQIMPPGSGNKMVWNDSSSTIKSTIQKMCGVDYGNYIITVIDANTISLNGAVATVLGPVSSGNPYAAISNQLGDGTLTRANRKQEIGWQGAPGWKVNFGNADAVAFGIARLSPSFVGAQYGFGDAMDSTLDVGYNQPLLPPLASQEYQCKPNMSWNTTRTIVNQYHSDFQAYIAAVRAANGNKKIQANISNYNFPADLIHATACGAAQLEQSVNMGQNDGLRTYINRIAPFLAANVQLVIMEGIFYTDLTATQQSPHGYSTGAKRWKSAFYAWYCMCLPQDPAKLDYLYYDDSPGRWTDNQADYYTKVCEVPLGYPLSIATSATVSVPGNGAIGTELDRVFFRQFEEGLVVGRWPNDSITNTLTATGDNYATTIKLPTAPAGQGWYRVFDDGVPQAVASVDVSLNRIDAAIFAMMPL